MADHIPFTTGTDSGTIVKNTYSDSDIVRVPLRNAQQIRRLLPPSVKVWIDPCVDGMDDLETRKSRPDRINSWFDFMSCFPSFEKIGANSYHAKPIADEVYSFVKAVLDKCSESKPAWITVPQFPFLENSSRNKINRALALATGKWKSTTGYAGRLILPLVFKSQNQVNRKTERNPKVKLAKQCYHESQADGFWAVDKSLADDNGSSTLRNPRFPGVISLHEELNESISSRIRVAGPYWGLNLVLWAKGLVDYPAIGVGSGYQFFLSGGHAQPPTAKLALPSLRRRVVAEPRLRTWLTVAINKLSEAHPAHLELKDILDRLTFLSQPANAREQVASFYKKWFNLIASTPKAGRSMALFQDLAAAYALGKSLPDLPVPGTERRPEAVAEPLMLSCL